MTAMKHLAEKALALNATFYRVPPQIIGAVGMDACALHDMLTHVPVLCEAIERMRYALQEIEAGAEDAPRIAREALADNA